jgi:hypothetical protein
MSERYLCLILKEYKSKNSSAKTTIINNASAGYFCANRTHNNMPSNRNGNQKIFDSETIPKAVEKLIKRMAKKMVMFLKYNDF